MLQTVIAAFCIFLFFGYMLSLWRLHERENVPPLLPAIAATMLMLVVEIFIAHQRFPLVYAGKLLLLSQALICPAWFLFSISYGRAVKNQFKGKLVKILFIVSCLPLAAAFILPPSTFYYQTDFYLEPVLFLEPHAFFFYLTLVLGLMISIGNLESTLRECKHSDRWRIKMAILGSGTIITSLILFYGQALLFKSMNMLYVPLRNMGVVFGLMLLMFAERHRGSGRVTISRKVAFSSVAVLLAGLYMIGMGLFREGVRIFGDAFEYYIWTSVLFMTVLGGLLLLLSDSLRRKVSIWIQRNLYNEKYDYKNQWLKFSGRLSKASDTESLILAVLKGFCETFGLVNAAFVPISGDVEGSHAKGIFYEMPDPSESNIDIRDFAALQNRSGTPENLQQLLPDIPFKVSTYLIGVNVSLIMAVRAADEPEGVILMGKPMDESEKYTVEDYELMEAMGSQLGLCIRSFRLGDELSQAKEMEAFNKLSAFVMHDLKNQVYALSLLTENAQRFIADPEFQQDMLETLGNTVANMRILVTQLTQLPQPASLRLNPADLHELAAKARAMVPGANVEIQGPHMAVNVDTEQILKVFTNLYLNAVEAGGERLIEVEIRDDGGPSFICRDHAGGIAEQALKKGLFKPFNTTKQHGMGIGLYHCQRIVEAHGGKMNVENNPPEGCTFIVSLPAASSHEANAPIATDGENADCSADNPG